MPQTMDETNSDHMNRKEGIDELMNDTNVSTTASSTDILSKPEITPECDRSNTNDQNETNNNNDIPNPKVVERLKSLADAFAKRGEEVKRRISEPLHSSSEESVSGHFRRIIFEEEWMQNMDITRVTRFKKSALSEFCHKFNRRKLGVFEPQSSIYITWLFVVGLAFIYNSVVIFLRSVFPYETNTNRIIFFIFDYFCDIIYLMDIIWFQMRLKFVRSGQWIEDLEMTRKNYLKKNRFIYDCLSLLPLDLIYFIYGFDKPLLRLVRLNRLLKVQTFWEFFTRIDAITSFPYLIRIVHTLIYKIYLIHLSTCAYYLMSGYEGFGVTPWTYNNKGNAYLRCFYFAFRTATSIGGRMPKPTNDFERIYMIFSWLMGVFIFALLIGQIRDIVATATQNSTNYRNVMNQAVRYMRDLDLPYDLQKRVRLWLTYTWAQQKTFNENQILELLPLKMRTDLALSMHYHTLSRVELFKDCDRNFIRELVIKFRSVLFLPGDYVCRKGEIGHEMYIINKGEVCVMDTKEENKILATLSEGSVFGEVSILGITGFNRRTADVKSKGYSNLFVLSKTDLMETLREYPEYQDCIKEKVRRLMKGRENADGSSKIEELDVDSIVQPVQRAPTPRMVQTVLQLVSPDSRVSQMLNRSSRSSRSSQSSITPVSGSSQTTLHLTPTVITCNPSLDFVEVSEKIVEDSENDDKNAIDNQFINEIVCKF